MTDNELLQSINTNLEAVKTKQISDAQALIVYQTQVIEYQTKQIFLMQAIDIAVCFIFGMFLWRMIVLAKNQRHMW